ncbi:MAG: efflux RND transporter periplasmic adaptor subunit [Gammaproteobacteria bacterium]
MGIAALIIALGAAAWGIASRAKAAAELRKWTEARARPTVALIELVRTDSDKILVLPGTLRAYIDAPIYARVSGYLKRWYVDIGAHVKAGEVLAEIETPELDQQLLQAQADLATAQANERLSASTSARWAKMLESDSVPRQEADEKAGDYEAKKNIVAAAEANVARLRATSSFKKIVAPFAGVVTVRRTDVGALINAGAGAGQELFRVADIHKARIYVDVPQTYAGALHAGTTAVLRVPERPGVVFHAVVADTSASISENSRTMLVELEADNAKGELLAGSYVDVSFTLAPQQGMLRLPISALLFRRDGLEVATLGRGNKVQMKSVTLGRDYGTEVEVLSGLNSSDRVVDSPPDSLTSGDEVTVAKTGAVAAPTSPAG